MKNDVNEVYVTATNGQDITTVASAITKAVPGATVTDQDSLASQVTGSISSAVVAGQQPRQVARDRGPHRRVPAGQPAHDVGRVAPDP